VARESKAKMEARAAEILRRLHREYPDAHCFLNFASPLQLLIATILAAQATDEGVNKVTPDLFRRFPTARAFAEAEVGQIEDAIKTIGLFRNKAKSIHGACRVLADDYGGDVPRTMEELVKLPGVGRKTANVVLGTAYGVQAGIVVDTHALRLSGRLGFTPLDLQDAVKVERVLIELFPQEDWTFVGHALTGHGRFVCTARKPNCPECVLSDVCPKRGVERN